VELDVDAADWTQDELGAHLGLGLGRVEDDVVRLEDGGDDRALLQLCKALAFFFFFFFK